MRRRSSERAACYVSDPEVTGEVEIDLGLPKRPIREPFLKGPLLLRELFPIARMPGKALALWLLILHRTGINRNQPCTLPARILVEWGINKDAKVEALRRLELQGLITVERPRGFMLKVKLVRRHRRDDK
jgi:hypothetical protein